jgi:hypothetical protein
VAAPVASAEPPHDSGSGSGPPGGKGLPARRILLALSGLAVLAGIVIALVIVLGGDSGDGDNTASSTPTVPVTTATDPGTGTGTATLASVLVPTQIAKECKERAQPISGALATDDCTSPPSAKVSDPDEFEFSFFPGTQALLQEYRRLLTDARGGAGQSKPLAKCGSNAAGQESWVHPTGKLGGKRFCYTDDKGNYTIVWTHEKRGSADHVDTLGIAREPGRSPTIYSSWWSSAKDFMGKCRPQVSQQLCLETIQTVTGKR